MKKFYLLSAVTALVVSLFAENTTAQCDGKRYKTKIFDSVTLISDVVYGSNFTYDATKQQLGTTKEDQFIDIYLPPDTDKTIKRPLIIFAHGGSFLNGTKLDGDIVHFCNEFAKRGYATASISYRLGYEQPIDSQNAVRAVYRALQDGRAAIRYMRANADSFQIDPDRIFFGGTSAGALIAVNIAYLNLPSEVPSYVDTSAHSTLNIRGLDGIEGKTNTINVPSTISGIINFCGATKTTAWMEDAYSRSIPIISMHGTDDQIVPYGTDFVYINRLLGLSQPDIPLIEIQGSYPIHQKAQELGIPNSFYTWCAAPHVPYIGEDSVSMAYMDTLISFTNRGIYEKLMPCGYTPGYETNSSACFSGSTAVTTAAAPINMSIYPNPVNNELVVSTDIQGAYSVSIYNIAGQKMSTYQGMVGEIARINTGNLAPGSYFIRIENESGTTFNKFIKN